MTDDCAKNDKGFWQKWCDDTLRYDPANEIASAFRHALATLDRYQRALIAEIPEAAKHVLCRSYRNPRHCRPDFWWIDRTLGYETWRTNGEKGRKDIAPLYRAGLVQEWFSPWSQPLFLTPAGVKVRSVWRQELGYNEDREAA